MGLKYSKITAAKTARNTIQKAVAATEAVASDPPSLNTHFILDFKSRTYCDNNNKNLSDTAGGSEGGHTVGCARFDK
jgi:hypothetical protein